jgi:Bacterial Ig-like domain (group 3)
MRNKRSLGCSLSGNRSAESRQLNCGARVLHWRAYLSGTHLEVSSPHVQVSAGTGESCTATLASGAATCSITFTTAGPRTFTAAYSGDANFNSSTSAGVSQTVVAAAALKIAPSSVNFGNVYVGFFGVQFVTLTNTGMGPISIKTVAIASSGGASPEFFDTSVCPSTLAANKSCIILLSFIPARDATTVHSATLVITDSAAGSPQSVPLTGTPINPRASLSTFDLDFASQKVGSTSSPMTVTPKIRVPRL